MVDRRGVVALLVLVAIGSVHAEGPPRERRTPWTASRFVGTPDPPPPYRVELAFPHLKFAQPVVLTWAPGIDRVFVGELGGKVVSFPNDPEARKVDLALDLARERPGFGQLFGIAFHPKFAENRHVFLCYTVGGGPDGTRVSRFRVDPKDPPRIDPESETMLLTWFAGGHNAGCLAFGPDGDLYISAGDGADPSPPDPFDTGQDLSDLLGSILRIDVDHQDPGKSYRVPPDNPFVKTPGARPEIWAFGLRNPWRFSFDREKGDLWAGDVGWELWEMIYRVERGGNYGWSLVEGRQPVRPNSRRGPGPVIPPVVDHPHSEAASITGGYVSRGSRLKDLVGTYIYGDFQSGMIWGLRHDGKAVTWKGVLAESPLQLVSFGEDAAGEVYALDFERTGQVYRLAPNPAARATSDFPRTLSRTGLFASTKDHAPAPGVVPYAINAAMWSDGAQARRLLAIPNDGRIDLGDGGRWILPDGSVLARTVSVGSTRVETQILHREGGAWRPYTYVWDDDQADATLAPPEGASKALPGGERGRAYRVLARSECVLCHNPWVEAQTTMFGRQSASPLGFNAAQIRRDDQLQALARLGLFAKPLPPDTPKLADPYDESAPLGARARSYLHVNCAHCHQNGAGGSTTILLGHALDLDQMRTVGARPLQGTFGIDDARIIAPGDPEGSVLYYRMAKMGGGRMPRAGSDLVDERAVPLIRDWIASLHGSSRPAAPEDASALASLRADGAHAEAIRHLLNSTRGALLLMGALDRGDVRDPARREVVAAARAHGRVEVRDLFERFLAPSERVERLGDAIRPETILALRGDPARGRELFFAESAATCKSCHKIGGAGNDLGPDLSRIGARYAKPELLRHILEPSLAVEPKYAAYLLATKDGEVHAGLLAEKNDREIILKDAQNREVRVPAADVEQLAPQPKSLMPELLLRDLTAQQAADLLEFLAGQKTP